MQRARHGGKQPPRAGAGEAGTAAAKPRGGRVGGGLLRRRNVDAGFWASVRQSEDAEAGAHADADAYAEACTPCRSSKTKSTLLARPWPEPRFPAPRAQLIPRAQLRPVPITDRLPRLHQGRRGRAADPR